MSRLARRLRRHARTRPTARAVFAGDRWWTFGELVAAAESLGLEVGAGEVVAVVMARGIEAVLAICAAVLAGAVPAVIDPGDPELAARTLAQLRPAVVVTGPGGGVPSAAVLDLARAPTLAPGGPPPWQPVRRAGLALVIFTSSSTADAKGVAWSEARASHDWTSNPSTVLQREGPGAIAVPLCTALGIQDLLRALHHGLATVLLDVPFRAGLEQARALGVNRIKLTPTHVDVLLATSVELPALRVALVASAPIAPDQLRALAARLPAARIGRSYGLTESGAATAVWLDRHPGRLHTVGRAIGYRRVTVRDPDGRVLPPRTWGEVVIEVPVWDRGDGYLDAPPELARRFDNAMLWTGDRGKLDGRGFLVLGARHAEILKVGGRSVSAPRVEQALHGAAGVAELAVVGVPDRALGQVACAVFVPAPGCRPAGLPATAAAMRADEAPRWFLPRHALPRGPSGKLRRGLLGTEAARWTSSFPQLVAPDHRSYPAYALDPRLSIIDAGTAPWCGDPAELAPSGRVIVLASRRPVRVLALAYLQAGAPGAAACRFIAGPFAVDHADAEVTDALLQVFAGELIRLVALLPGARPRLVLARPAREASAYLTSGFAPARDGWLSRGDDAPLHALADAATGEVGRAADAIAAWARAGS